MAVLKIRQLRTNRKWALEFVSRRVGVSAQMIHAVETGKRKPSYELLIQLCDLYNIPIELVKQLFEEADA